MYTLHQITTSQLYVAPISKFQNKIIELLFLSRLLRIHTSPLLPNLLINVPKQTISLHILLKLPFPLLDIVFLA